MTNESLDVILGASPVGLEYWLKLLLNPICRGLYLMRSLQGMFGNGPISLGVDDDRSKPLDLMLDEVDPTSIRSVDVGRDPETGTREFDPFLGD